MVEVVEVDPFQHRHLLQLGGRQILRTISEVVVAVDRLAPMRLSICLYEPQGSSWGSSLRQFFGEICLKRLHCLESQQNIHRARLSFAVSCQGLNLVYGVLNLSSVDFYLRQSIEGFLGKPTRSALWTSSKDPIPPEHSQNICWKLRIGDWEVHPRAKCGRRLSRYHLLRERMCPRNNRERQRILQRWVDNVSLHLKTYSRPNYPSPSRLLFSLAWRHRLCQSEQWTIILLPTKGDLTGCFRQTEQAQSFFQGAHHGCHIAPHIDEAHILLLRYQAL